MCHWRSGPSSLLLHVRLTLPSDIVVLALVTVVLQTNSRMRTVRGTLAGVVVAVGSCFSCASRADRGVAMPWQSDVAVIPTYSHSIKRSSSTEGEAGRSS